MPNTKRDIDFAVLEQKLINLEKEERLKEIKIKNAFKSMGRNDPYFNKEEIE